MRRFVAVVCALVFALGLSACDKKKDKPEQNDSVMEEVAPKRGEDIVEVIDENEGKTRSKFTNLYIDEEVAKQRPVAIMINNLHKALPQSGISQADIIYEALAEGEITRLVAVFQDFNAEKIGPIRSAREYYVLCALDNSAIFVHHGASPGGYSFIRGNKIDSVDGMEEDGRAFFRDKARLNKPGMYEHSSYTSRDALFNSFEKRGYDTTLRSSYTGMFLFNDEPVIDETASDATTITIPYSSYHTTTLNYDSEKKNYTRSQSGTPHIDVETGEELRFENVIIQFAEMTVIDSEGRRDTKLIGSGRGLYFSMGKVSEIKWDKRDMNSPTAWSTLSGERLKINSGKTNICIVPADMKPEIL